MQTKKVFYDEGPLRIKCGEAGYFQIGVPREIFALHADVLIQKGIVKEFIVPTIKKRKEEV